MVLTSQHSLTASTTLASIISAAILTAVGLCVPYTEHATKNRTAQSPHASPGQPIKATQSPRRGGEIGAGGSGSGTRSGAANAAQH